MVDMMYPSIGMATVELLEQHGVEVLFPLEQTCCGQPAFTAGYQDEARQLAHRFIEVFEPMLMAGEIEAVVAPSESCVTMTTRFYQTLFQGGASNDLLRRAQTLAEATFDLTQFLVDVLGVTHTNAKFPYKVTHHSCCHLPREPRQGDQSLVLLRNVGDAQLVDHDEADASCGFSGFIAERNVALDTAIGERKLNNLAKSEADFVAVADVGCMAQINGLLQKQGQRAKAIHISEILNAQIAPQGEDTGAAPESSAPSSPPRHQKPVHKEKRIVRPSKPRRWQE